MNEPRMRPRRRGRRSRKNNMENSLTVNILIAAVILSTISEISLGLRILHVTIPSAVKSGDIAQLVCDHDTEDEALYAVKWYRGTREFFRYTPKEIPAVKIFSFPGLHIDVDRTNETHLVMQNVTPKVSGRYICEVSADAPSFATSMGAGDMEIVVLPTRDVEVIGIKPFYQVGEMLQANCTCYNSIPSALLEWKINSFPAHPDDIIKYKVSRNQTTKLESRTIGLRFRISQLHFQKGKLTIECTAKIHHLYEGETTKYAEEDRTHVYSPSLSYLSDEEYKLKNSAAAATTTPASLQTMAFVAMAAAAAATATTHELSIDAGATFFGHIDRVAVSMVQKYHVICRAAALIYRNFFQYTL